MTGVEFLKDSKNWRTYSEEDMGELIEYFHKTKVKNVGGMNIEYDVISTGKDDILESLAQGWNSCRNTLLDE